MPSLLRPWCCRRKGCPNYKKFDGPGTCPTCGADLEVYDRVATYRQGLQAAPGTFEGVQAAAGLFGMVAKGLLGRRNDG